MITLSKSGSTVTFTFDENSGYLQNGTIDVPVNSLSLVIDESDNATFRKSASNDIFISARYEEFGMTKSELESWYKANMVSSGGGGGGTGGTTPEEVQQMIDESISGKADTSAVTESISAATDDMATQTWVGEQGYITGVDLSNYATLDDVSEATSGKVDTSDFNTYSGTVDTAINSKASESDLSALTDVVSAHTANTDIHVTTAQTAAWNAKSDFSGSYNDLTDKLSAGTNITIVDNVISAEGGGGTVDTAITSGSSNAVCSSAIWNAVTYNNNVTIEFDESTHISTNFPSGCTNLQVTLNDSEYGEACYLDFYDGNFDPIGYLGITAFEGEVDIENNVGEEVTFTTAYTNNIYETFITWPSTVDVVSIQKWVQMGPHGTVVAIMNGGWINENTYTKSEVDAALSGKQDTLSAGTNITIVDNVISATGGGGGTTYSAGTNIEITTADTINCTLPITVDNNSIVINNGGTITDSNQSTVIGFNNKIKNRAFSVALGASNTISASSYHTNASVALGASNTIIEANSNDYSIACGYGNHSSGGTTPSNVTIMAGYTTRFVCGSSNEAYNCSQLIGGYHNKASNFAEVGGGSYNNSVSATTNFGDSGNTLFSVGNGIFSLSLQTTRHNAFEIRQNGDVYYADTADSGEFYEKPMIKLQDKLSSLDSTIGNINTILESI